MALSLHEPRINRCHQREASLCICIDRTVSYLELPKDRCVRSCGVINVKKTEVLRTPLAAKEPEPLSPNSRPLLHNLQHITGHTIMAAPLGRLRRAHQGIG